MSCFTFKYICSLAANIGHDMSFEKALYAVAVHNSRG